MHLSSALLFLSATLACADRWPYNRYHSHGHRADVNRPEFDSRPHNRFLHWLRDVTRLNDELQVAFKNNSIPHHVSHLDDLIDHLDLPSPEPEPDKPALPLPPTAPYSAYRQAMELFDHLGYPVDPRCAIDRSWWYYRTYDGSCNFLKKDDSSEGATGMAKARDFGQHHYADNISTPREGPNPRAVSNAFFKRKKALYYEHTPLLLGMIEFIMHDITYSKDSATEYIDVEMPEDEKDFPMNTTLRVYRTEAVPGTGTGPDNPRENVNLATTWLDISSLYGSTPEIARALRSFSGGKLLTQEVQARGTKSKASYLPWNSMRVPARTRPGVAPEDLFAGGDSRTNEDWMLLGVHTLLLREHNRLCGIIAKRHPDWNDERIYQTTRLVMGAKYMMMANAYQMAYWTDKMPWPRDDGFPLFREMYGKGALQINPANTYPFPLVTKKGRPMVVSAEMAVVYRFHEFIIAKFPIKDAANKTLWEQDLFETGFNAKGFLDAGLENVLRGMVATHIPNFKSGVDENFRTAGLYRGRPFDVAVSSIVREREQGLPTFNHYFREYNKQDPFVEVPIRERFEDFSNDTTVVADLRRLYRTPDDVDLVVGVQLDEEMFPGTTVPKSALIISLFSLFGMGNSDRFSVGFSMMRCLLVDKPWDCQPSNALEELLWSPRDVPGFPNFRFYDTFWLTELDLQAHGANLLWRLVTENTEIKCLQHRPLFPADRETNPILCMLPKSSGIVEFCINLPGTALSMVEVGRALFKQHEAAVYSTFALLAVAYWRLRK